MIKESLTNKEYLRRLVWIWYNKSTEKLFKDIFFPLMRLIILNFMYFLSTDTLQKILEYRLKDNEKKERKLLEQTISKMQADDLPYIIFEDYFD